MNRSTAFLWSLICFMIGIGLHTLAPFAPLQYGLTSLSCVLIALIISQTKTPKLITPYVFLFVAALSLGLWRGQSTVHIPHQGSVDFYASEERNQITLTGRISEEPDIRRDKINYTIAVESLRQGDAEPIAVSGSTLISTGKYPPRFFGDRVEVSGHLRSPGRFDTFDYAGYLSRYGIYSVIYRPRIRMIEPFTGQHPFAWLLETKKAFEYQMNQTFPSEPTSSFMAGLLLGSRKGMPEKLTEDFRITGLTHIVAISGYNITLIVAILMGIFKPLGRKPSIWISAVGIILFTLFVGASAAVVRACIMGLISLIALNSERKGQITITLVLTAVLMIAYNPKILVHDVGFQLSFLATMGLIYVAPLIEPFFTWLPDKLAIRESILLTLSAQIMALPIILFNFNNLSLVSPLSNLLIAGPILPLAMLFGFVGTMVSFVFVPLAKLIAFPAYLLLEYVVWITSLTAQIPYATVEIHWFDQFLFWSYFAAISFGLLILWKHRHQREQRITAHQIQFEHLISQLAFCPQYWPEAVRTSTLKP